MINELKDGDESFLVNILTADTWPFHSKPVYSPDEAQMLIAKKVFDKPGTRTFLVANQDEVIGFIRLFDLGEGSEDPETPLFDIRIKAVDRGKGTGTFAVSWLVDFVFEHYPNKRRLEANTRVDNFAMRRVLEKCGFVKEAHYRQNWPDNNGGFEDTVGYGILRSDWENKTLTSVEWEN